VKDAIGRRLTDDVIREKFPNGLTVLVKEIPPRPWWP
jgi:hypothetical protein